MIVRQNLPPVSIEITALKINQACHLIPLDEFVSRWQVSRADLATLTDTPLDTVKSWFRSDPLRRTAPNLYCLHRLTLAHNYWDKLLSRQESTASQSRTRLLVHS